MLEENVPNPLAKNPSFHTHKVFAAIGIILIFSIIIIGGVWYFVQSAQDKVPATEDNSVKVSTSSAKNNTKDKTVPAVKDETADWITYSNTNYGFSIKYPISWNYNDKTTYETQNCNPIIGIDDGLVLFAKNSLRCVEVPHMNLWDEKIEFVVYSTSKFEPLKAITGEQYKDIVLDGEKAVKNFKSDTSEGPRCTCTRVYVNHNNKGFMIEFVNKDLKGNHDSIYDIILSTFKFL